MKFRARSLHRKVAPVVFVLLAISAVTGMVYRVGKAWFGMDGQTGQTIMEIHTGGWLGEDLSPLYVFIVGIGLLGLLVSGLWLLVKSRAQAQSRIAHRLLGAVLALPLTASATTGMLYLAGTRWLGFPEHTNDLLMSIHEGAWLGPNLKVFYVLFVGGGLLALGLFGLWICLPRQWTSKFSQTGDTN